AADEFACNDGSCIPESWECDVYWCDCGDCEDEADCESVGNDDCETGTVEDCSGDGDCAPDYWVGDGYCDGADQPYGYDLTCYDNDGGDCDGRSDSDVDEGFKLKGFRVKKQSDIAHQQFIDDETARKAVYESAERDDCGGTGPDTDCAGVCFGDAAEDCSGDCGGSATVDDCGDCNGSNDCLAMGWFVANGGLNEVALQWGANSNAAAYNISRDGVHIFTMPQGYGEAWIDNGFNGNNPTQGLGFDIEYCYSITAVSASGNGGASAEACATTLPQLQAFLDLDLSLANAEVAAVAS
ncbi:uncharacterized protein METZ01_LOCUS382432, partial [marine metagenome]